MKLYTIKDNLVGFCNPPFQCQNDEAAKRLFIMLAKQAQENIVNTFPESKELWALGELDEQTGSIMSDVRFLERALPHVAPPQSPWAKAPEQRTEEKRMEVKSK